MSDRYDASGSPEGQFEPGSDGRVLANRLRITNPADMAAQELERLELLYEYVLDAVTVEQRLSVRDLCDWHRRWLGDIYVWAGNYRSVNMGKGGFSFAAAAQVPRLMSRFDTDVLARYTPCHAMSEHRLAEAIAIVHIEFILIHPFREGNGRLSRLLATVMALQAGWPLLDFTSWDNDKAAYFSAIQAGLDDYQPMIERVSRILRDSAGTDAP